MDQEGLLFSPSFWLDSWRLRFSARNWATSLNLGTLSGLMSMRVWWASRQLRVTSAWVAPGARVRGSNLLVERSEESRIWKRWETPRLSRTSTMRGLGLTSSRAEPWPLLVAQNLRPIPERTPRKVLSIMRHSANSKTKRL